MITATEIRYGNWVQNHNGCPVQVNFHFFGMIERLGKDRSDGTFGILLTPEVLEKCGFTRLSGREGWEWKKGYFTIGEVSYYFIEGPGFSRKIEFLHQLQNLHFALCGEEITYTP